jgi:hypothetical protein
LKRNVEDLFPTLGIPMCLVCIFESGDGARVSCGYDGDRRFSGSSLEAFPIAELLPRGLLGTSRRTLLVESLYLEGKALGYVAFEMGPSEPEVYEICRDYLTGALRGLLTR